MDWKLIFEIAAIGVLFINSEPTIRLRSFYKREDWFFRLINCCLCSTFHIYFWYNLLWLGILDIGGASLCAILAELVCQKLNEGRL